MFQNILPTTSLILPNGGSQSAGSGTVIVGANAGDGTLPAEIIAAYGVNASAIIWYSSAANAAKVVYYYLLYNGSAGFAGVIELGYLPVGLGTILSISQWLGEFGSGRNDIFSTNDMSARSLDVAGGIVPLASGALSAVTAALSGALSAASAALTGALTAASATLTGAINAASAAITGAITAASLAATGAVTALTLQATTKLELVNGSDTTKLHNNATSSYLTDTDPGIDVFQTGIALSAVVGGSTLTGTLNIKCTYDRIVEMYFNLTGAATVGVGNAVFAGIVPAAFRPVGGPRYGGYSGNINSGNANSNAAAGQLAILAIGSGTTTLTGSVMYTISKPTF